MGDNTKEKWEVIHSLMGENTMRHMGESTIAVGPWVKAR
jgi:hypothetical protein